MAPPVRSEDMQEPRKPSEAEVVLPPAPPGEVPAEAVEKTKAVAEALAELGEDTDPERLAEHVRIRKGIRLDPDEAAVIKRKLREHAKAPPSLDQSGIHGKQPHESTERSNMK